MEERFIIIQFVAVLANCLQQFGVYNVYKDDRYGLDLTQDGGPNHGVFLQKILPKHSLILQVIYSFVIEMKFWVVSNPLPQVKRPEYRMHEVNPNPSYKCYKYTKGFIGTRVSNVHHYKEIIDTLNCNWGGDLNIGCRIIFQIGLNFYTNLYTNFTCIFTVIVVDMLMYIVLVTKIYIGFTIRLQFE